MPTFEAETMAIINSQVWSLYAIVISIYLQETQNNPTKEQVQTFVDENFDPEGSEFEEWEPSDWNEDIKVLSHIKVNQFL